MKQKREEILEWLSQDVKSYEQGCDLAERYGSKFAANIFRHSSPQYKMGRLTAYLRSLCGQCHQDTVIPREENATIEPQPIQRAKAKLHEVWLKLNDYNNRLQNMGDDNSDSSKAARVELMAERKPWIDAFEDLWSLKEEYFAYPEDKRKIPSELVSLLDSLDGKSSESPSKVTSARKELDVLSDLQLSRKRHAIVTSIGKANNKLRFQQPTPAEHLDPMPEGPKRKKLEAHIEELRKELLIVDELIQQRGL